MADPAEKDATGVRERLTQALHHGIAAARCFVALLGAEATAAINRVARRAALLAIVLFAAAVAVIFVLWGAAQLLGEWLGRPGLGPLIVGLVVLALVAVALSQFDDKDSADQERGADDAP